MTSTQVVEEDRGIKGLRARCRRSSGSKSLKTYMDEWENDTLQSCKLFCKLTAEQVAGFVACFEMVWCTIGFWCSVVNAYSDQPSKASGKKLPNNSAADAIVLWIWVLGMINSYVLWSGVINRNYWRMKFWYSVTLWVVGIRIAVVVGYWLSRFGNPCEFLPTLVPQHVPACRIYLSNIYVMTTKVPGLHVYTLQVFPIIICTLFEVLLVKIVLKHVEFFMHARIVVANIYKVRPEQQPQNVKGKQGTETV